MSRRPGAPLPIVLFSANRWLRLPAELIHVPCCSDYGPGFSVP